MTSYPTAPYRFMPPPPPVAKPAPRPLYFAGLDLGQSKDYSALSIIERTIGAEDNEPSFALRHLHRYELGTPYPAIVNDVVETLRREPLASAGASLAIDQTGVGAAVGDLFRRENLRGDFMPIIITGGDQVTYANGTWRVPKRDLCSIVQVCLQTSRLKIAPNLAHAATLKTELENFRVTINDSANDIYAARAGQHDDLVLSVALSLWTAARWAPEQLAAESYSFDFNVRR